MANNAVKNNMLPMMLAGAVVALGVYEEEIEANRDAIIDFVVEQTGHAREDVAEAFDMMMEGGRFANHAMDLADEMMPLGIGKPVGILKKSLRQAAKPKKSVRFAKGTPQSKSTVGGKAQPAEAAANPLAKHGKVPVKNKSDQEFVQDIANRADKLTPAIGPKAGQDKHKYARKLGERYQRMTGDRQDLVFEQRHKAGEVWKEGDGLKNSVIPDVYNNKTGQAFDYKFGNAKLGTDQQARLQQHLPQPLKKPSAVAEIKPQNGIGQ